MGRRKWWVVGCVGFVVVVLLVVGSLAAMVFLSIRSADPQSAELVREPSRAGIAPQAVPREPGTPLEVTLEFDSCEVYVEPAEPGEPLSVEAHYNASDFRLEEVVDEANPNAYRLRFLITSSRLITSIKQGLRGGQAQLRVRLPVGTPVELKLVQRNGGAFVDLSGLQLTGADFDIGGAILKLDADRPLQGELERLRVKGRQGAVVVESLNLMRPRDIEVDFRMGQAQLDFRGEWVSDANVALSFGMLDTLVRLPRDARVVGLGEGRFPAPSTEEVAPPTLTFTLESGARTNLRVFE